MNTSFLPTPRLWLSRSLWLGLFFCLLCSSCILEPFNLIGAPCTGDIDCFGLEVCIRGACRPKGTPPPDCTISSDCACGKQCITSQQVCVDITCRNDEQCRRTNCESYHCDLNTSKCKQGEPPAPFCNSPVECNGQLCVDNRCTKCKSDDECQTTGRCDKDSGKCIPCEGNDDCAPKVCDTNSKRCVPCTSHEQCASRLCKAGVCSECSDDADCPTLRCDKGAKKCLPCQKNSDCATQLCVSDTCKECKSNQDCTNSGGSCKAGVCTGACSKGSDCGSNFCKEGVCALCANDEECPSKRCLVGGRCGGACKSDTECSDGRVCDSGVCEPPGEGQPCAPPLNCRAPFACVEEGSGKVCRSPCSPLTPKCPSGQACQFLPNSTNPAGLCVSPNSGKDVGATCDPLKEECKTGLHCFKGTQGSTCRILCALNGGEPKCNGQEVCVKINDKHPDIGACIVATCGTAGTVCKSTEKCIDKQCKKICTKDDECETSQFCFTSGGDKYCKEKECDFERRACTYDMFCDNFSCTKLPDLPKTCSSVSNCTSGKEYCVDIPGVAANSTINPKRCWKKCTSTACGKGYHCVVTDLGNGSKACFPKIGGGLTGASCGVSAGICETSHICATTQSTRSDPRCVPSCHPKGSSPKCKDLGFTCGQLGGNSEYGVCTKNDSGISLNKACGSHLGRCLNSYAVCFSSSLLTDKKAYCRELCTNSNRCRTSGYTCRSFVVGTLGTFKFCVPR